MFKGAASVLTQTCLFLYRFTLTSFQALLPLASKIGGNKVRRFYLGRVGLFTQLKKTFSSKGNATKRVWIHVASLGEFEQARSIIEELKKQNFFQEIILTFFSPSGYEIRKNYPLVDYIFYLPLDSKRNAEEFLNIVKPSIAIFVKYDFWYDYLLALSKRKIPFFYVSCLFRRDHWLFSWYGTFFWKVLNQTEQFFVQDKCSQDRLVSYTKRVTIAGDTRFDRVLSIAKKVSPIPLIKRFVQEKKVLVVGSSWESDLIVLKDLIIRYQEEIKIIIAPHNPSEANVKKIIQSYDGAERYTTIRNFNSHILVIDNVGMLSFIYQYAHIAYVGGGMRGALHNVLEAAVFGIPIIFGEHKKNSKFKEAKDLINIAAAFSVKSKQDCLEKFTLLMKDSKIYDRASTSARDYVINHQGATKTIMSYISKSV